MDFNTASHEYQVYHLDPNTKMSHIESAPLLDTDRLDEACSFIHEAFKNEGLELCIFQPRSNGYCGYCRKPQNTRDRKTGRFTKA